MKLSLNETWKRCLKMWKGVIAILDLAKENDEKISVYLAKQIWLQQHGYKKHIINDCFFCDYAENHSGEVGWASRPSDCKKCPGHAVDPDFACEVDAYHWANEPKKFYEKLLQLNRKRRAKK